MMDDDQHEAYGAMIHRGKVEQKDKEVSKEMKLCKDCKWARPTKTLFVFPRWGYAKCDAPLNIIHSPFDGSDNRVLQFCMNLRDSESEDCCGYDAKWFEPKVIPPRDMTHVVADNSDQRMKQW